MRRRILQLSQLTIVLSGICLCSSVHALTTPHSKIISASSNNKTVRVRLTETIARAEVRGFDLSLLAGPTRKYSTSKDKMSRWEFRCSNGKVRALQLLEKGASAAIELPEPVTIHTPAGFLSFGGKPYRNELRIYSKGSTCEVINEVDLEKYLDGLVNSEFSARWNEDAIAAQVVAARTYAYYQMLQARAANRHYDVDATIKDQVYDGSIREDFRSSRAVEKSHGIVLTLGTANAPVPLKAFYHSTCGGHTELPQNVWGNPHPGFKRAVRCEFCNRSPVYSWDVPMNGKEIGQALKAGALKGGAFPGWPKNWKQTLQKGQLLDLRIAHITPQGRVLRLRTLWADGPNAVELTISGSRFREWIGSTRIKSALFQVSAERAGKRLAGVAPPGNKREWHFRGRGNGHGVGMCQWGAKVMGEKGYTMGAILKLYYPDAILRRLW